MNTSLLPPIIPDYCTSPGDSLLMTLEDLNMTQMELAARTGLTSKTINQIIHNKVAITPETAMRLEVATSTPANMWLNLDRMYREWLQFEELGKDKVRTAQAADFIKSMPYNELVALGYCRQYSKVLYKERELLRFFGVVGIEEYNDTYQELTGAARVGHSGSWNAKAFSAWVRIGQLKSYNQSAEPFDEKKLSEAVRSIRDIAGGRPQQVWPEIERLLRQAGVIALIVPEFRETHVAGFSYFIPKRKRAVLQLSLRGKRVGGFWFNLFHELCHLLKHSKKKTFVNCGMDEIGMDTLAKQDPDECEANEFARDILIPRSRWSSFVRRGWFTNDRIRSFAQEVNVSVDVVLGRLHIENIVPHTRFKNLRQSLTAEEMGAVSPV